MDARRFFLSTEIASTGQERTQGRRASAMALYGQACAHMPHSRHLSGLMIAPWWVLVIAPNRQACRQRCAKMCIRDSCWSGVQVEGVAENKGLVVDEPGSTFETLYKRCV